MKNDILDKLEEELSLPIKSERQVVYILVQIRKIMDQSPTLKAKHRSLFFYCNWALHPVLSRNDAKRLLGVFSNGINDKNLRILAFEQLREDLKKFFKEHSISTRLTDKGWFQFRKHLLQVIKDCPLHNKSAKGWEAKEFSYIGPEEGFEDMIIVYKIKFGNGKSEEANIILADQDEQTKKKFKEAEDRFAYHYNRKAFLKLMDERKTLKGKKGEEIDVVINSLSKKLKAYEKRTLLLED